MGERTWQKAKFDVRRYAWDRNQETLSKRNPPQLATIQLLLKNCKKPTQAGYILARDTINGIINPSKRLTLLLQIELCFWPA